MKYLLSARELGKQRSTSLIKTDTASFMNKKIIGIEILDASKHINLERLLPVEYRVSNVA